MSAVELCDDVISKLRDYAAMLGEANATARVTGPSDPEILFREHIADALEGLSLLAGYHSFIDVGTGGGLPGLVWAICRPNASVCLIDSIAKKIRVVRELAYRLNCLNVNAVNARSEDFAVANREKFDVATARAVADSRVLAEYLSPLVRTGGRLIAFKGPKASGEVRILERKWKVLGLSKPELHFYSIEGRSRCLVIWKKIGACHRRFPRRPGMAERHPWCGEIR
jgi:16S rRNA (guanine527-N7)-methyltransferase